MVCCANRSISAARWWICSNPRSKPLAIAVAALARQVDLGRLSADLLALQREAAVDEPNPIRDRQLNAIRNRLHPPLAD
ncbi:MAG: hypothetical protein M5R42_13290 [Rhodocyclaceae bacterium]|nr:hypothetical protein [Rhodocyclaceae bacterium]